MRACRTVEAIKKRHHLTTQCPELPADAPASRTQICDCKATRRGILDLFRGQAGKIQILCRGSAWEIMFCARRGEPAYRP